ncbi:MAG TPA: class I SAM-dependent methyltransferase [Longimicrobium sp.]|nr:class I SAM-dependent methyltransferase [Longimicrobium sp.]
MSDLRQRDALAASYDALAAEYGRRLAGELAHKPFDRALLDRFADRVRGLGPVVDVGCGPGQVAAYLHERGVDARGLDLSPAMVREARGRYPDVSFSVGDMTSLDEADGAWAAAVAFYSLIHLPRDEVGGALRELRRVLRAGGLLLVAFHVGDEVRHFDELWGVPVDLDFVLFTPGEMRGWLDEAGLTVEWLEERDPYPGVEAQTRRCYLLARAP